MPRRSESFPGAAFALGLCLFVSFILSLAVLGLSASVVAQDHQSKIAIAHLVVSTLVVILVICTFRFDIYCIDDADPERKSGSIFVVIFVFILMYTALVIPLSFDPVAKPDIRSGKGESFNTSSSYTSAPLIDHPYYGLFVVDLIIICECLFSCICICIFGCK